MYSTLPPINVKIPQFFVSPTTRKNRLKLKQRKAIRGFISNSFPFSVSPEETEALSCAYSIGMAVR